jgi:negative regulator of flagellin synthesis FlgM
MTDPISSYNRLARPELGQRPGSADRKGDREPSSIDNAPSAAPSEPSAPQSDQLILSDAAQQAMRAEVFDRAKVDAIKEALRNGQYPLDSRRIAESFQAIERLID